MGMTHAKTRRHRLVRLGALWLLLVGLPLLVVGAGLLALTAPAMLSPESCGSTCWASGITFLAGLAFLLLGAIHLVAFVGVWRHRRWGRVTGLIVAGVGLLSVTLFVGGPGSDLWWVVVLFAVPYGVTQVALIGWLPQPEAAIPRLAPRS